MAETRTSPPMIINTPEDGFLRVGLTTESTAVRPDQVQLAGGCGASLRIFDDGGWELRSVNKKAKENNVYKGRKSQIDVERIKTLKNEGKGATAIAKEMGIHRDSVYRLLKTQ